MEGAGKRGAPSPLRRIFLFLYPCTQSYGVVGPLFPHGHDIPGPPVCPASCVLGSVLFLMYLRFVLPLPQSGFTKLSLLLPLILVKSQACFSTWR